MRMVAPMNSLADLKGVMVSLIPQKFYALAKAGGQCLPRLNQGELRECKNDRAANALYWPNWPTGSTLGDEITPPKNGEGAETGAEGIFKRPL